MNLKKLLFLCMIPLYFSSTAQKRVVIIGLDGLSVEGFQKSKHPNLDALIKEGVLSLNTRSVMPSLTLPNWTSHLTSGGPEQHGVTSNKWRIDNQDFPPIEKDEQGYYPSIFKILKEQIPNIKTAYYYNWDDLINSMNKQYLDEVSFEKKYSYKDNYAKAFNFITENKLSPSLIFLYTVHIDLAGHSFKWMSPEYITAIEETDGEVGKLISNLKSKNLYYKTNFLLITDHGGTRDTGHGGLSIEEMEVPWAITGPGIIKGKPLTEPNSNTNTAMIISKLFGIKKTPKSWIGKVPQSIFK